MMKNILVIDDDILSAELIKFFLIDESCILSIEYSGDSGLNLFLNKLNFDLVFLDLNLPGIDGFEVCSAIRKINTSLPVVAYTALCEANIIERCKTSGFDDVILKPAGINEIKNMFSCYC